MTLPHVRLLLSRRTLLRTFLSGAVLFPALTGPARGQDTFSGRAFAAAINTPLTGEVVLSDTGELPARGGMRANSLLSVGGNPFLRADVLVASTSGGSGVAMSSASLA